MPSNSNALYLNAAAHPSAGFAVRLLELAGCEIAELEGAESARAANVDDGWGAFLTNPSRRKFGQLAEAAVLPDRTTIVFVDTREMAIAAVSLGMGVIEVSDRGMLGSDHVPCEFAVEAESGLLYSTGPYGSPPQRLPAGTVHNVTGVLAAIAAVAQWLGMARGIPAGRVEVTALQAAVGLNAYNFPTYIYRGAIPLREPRKDVVIRFAPCKDGWCYTLHGQPASLEFSSYATFLNCPELRDQRFATPLSRYEHFDEMAELFARALKERHREEWLQEALAWRFPVGIVRNASEVLACDHLRSRVLEIAPIAPDKSHGIPIPRFLSQVRTSDRGSIHFRLSSVPRAPLDGVRVLSFEQAISLPWATRILADLGADVVKVESPSRIGRRFIGSIFEYSRGKRSLGLDLTKPDARGILDRLAAWSDVVVENFTPRVKYQLGFDPESLQRSNPDLIALSVSGYGQEGNWSSAPAYGPALEATAGISHLLGPGPDSPPCRGPSILFSDYVCGTYAALAVLLAIGSGAGKTESVDFSMFEALVFNNSRSLVELLNTGQSPSRMGNRDSRFPVQDVFSTGPDRWVAVTIPDQSTAVKLAERLGCSASGLELEHRLRVEAACGEQHIIKQVGGDGVAVPVADIRDVLTNPATAAYFGIVTHRQPSGGLDEHPHLREFWSAEGWRGPTLSDPHVVGEDNHGILAEIGLEEGEIARLTRGGVLSQVGLEYSPQDGEYAGLTQSLELERGSVRINDEGFIAVVKGALDAIRDRGRGTPSKTAQ